MYKLLIVEADRADPDSDVRAALGRDGSFSCDDIRCDTTLPDALDLSVDMVVVSLGRDHASVTLLDQLSQRLGGKPILAVVPGDADEELLSRVVNSADDYIIRPVRSLELRHRVQCLLAPPRHDDAAVATRLLEDVALAKLIGRDPVFLRAVQQVPRFARFDMAVLITGETGTGKELCARALHHLSRRRNKAFVAVDCGAVPDQLFENELFGHARGAFTDAHRDHKGLVELADGGTLFLDEVDALSLAAQAKLLRFLQEHTFRALGSERSAQADVRVIGATNKDLDTSVKNGQFRTDLYFRLNVLRLRLPPLRERREDIPLLAERFLEECGAAAESAPTSISPSALRLLTAHDWPGNVRELCNVVQRAIVACDGGTIQPSHITIGETAPQAAPTGNFRAARNAALAAFERRYVEDLLVKHGGNVTHAAREAQQDRRAFGRVLKKYRIDRTAV